MVDFGGRLVLHRVVGVEGDSIRTKGDGSMGTDGALPAERVLAEAIAVNRGGMVVPLVMTTRFGLRALFAYALERARRGLRGTLLGRLLSIMRTRVNGSKWRRIRHRWAPPSDSTNRP
jgi:hypothetical protein